MFVLHLSVKFDRLRSVGSSVIGVKLKAEENFQRISHLWDVSSDSLTRTVLIYLRFRRHKISPRHGSRRPARKSTTVLWRKIWQEVDCWLDVPVATERQRRALVVCRRVHKVAKKRLLASSCLSVSSSVWNTLSSAGQIFVKVCFGGGYKNLSRKFILG